MRAPSGILLSPRAGQIASPLKWEVWASELSSHPDREYVKFVVDVIRGGFRIGFDRQTHSCRSSPGNMASARMHPQPIQEYLTRELEAERIVGPLAPGDVEGEVHVSRFGVIPKPHQPGKWRLITDLSSPEGV